MPDLIIKPAAQSGNKVIIQDQAGGAVITTADSGATIANATLVTPALGTPASGVVTNLSGVLPVGVTGGSGLTALGTVTSGNLSNTAIVYPSGHVVGTKTAILAVTGSKYIATSSTTWVGTHADLNLTYAISNVSNYLMFTVSSGQTYVPTTVNYLYLGIGKTTDLTGNDANIIRYGGDGVNGRWHSIKAYNTELTGATAVFKYYPSTTSSITYQPIQRTASAATGYWTNNSDQNNFVFMVQEIQI
jgi:hypothetical protein